MSAAFKHYEASMVTPANVEAFHVEYDRHPDDRVRLFGAVAARLPAVASVLYPGSYVDIAPSVWFDSVTYVDTDRRAARFFDQRADLERLIQTKRDAAGSEAAKPIDLSFHHHDYQEPLPVTEQSFDLLASLYAGFVSEHCTQYLAVGGHLLVNPSHGDAAMASIDPRYELAAVVTSKAGTYRLTSDDLDTYLIPKKPQTLSIEALHELGKGIGYTRSPFAYLFRRIH